MHVTFPKKSFADEGGAGDGAVLPVLQVPDVDAPVPDGLLLTPGGVAVDACTLEAAAAPCHRFSSPSGTF
eukprot:5123471-Pyramimonas_sp.AAC.1